MPVSRINPTKIQGQMDSKDDFLSLRSRSIKKVTRAAKKAVTNKKKLRADCYRTENMAKTYIDRRATTKPNYREPNYAALFWEKLEAELREYNQLIQTETGRQTLRHRSMEDEKSHGSRTSVPEAKTAINEFEPSSYRALGCDISRYQNGSKSNDYGNYRPQGISCSSETSIDTQDGFSNPMTSEDGFADFRYPQRDCQLTPRSEEMCEYLRAWPQSTRHSECVNICDHPSTAGQ